MLHRHWTSSVVRWSSLNDPCVCVFSCQLCFDNSRVLLRVLHQHRYFHLSPGNISAVASWESTTEGCSDLWILSRWIESSFGEVFVLFFFCFVSSDWNQFIVNTPGFKLQILRLRAMKTYAYDIFRLCSSLGWIRTRWYVVHGYMQHVKYVRHSSAALFREFTCCWSQLLNVRCSPLFSDLSNVCAMPEGISVFSCKANVLHVDPAAAAKNKKLRSK